MKKCIGITLAILMLVSAVFTGCSPSAQQSSETPQAAASAGAAQSQAPAEASKSGAPQKLSILFYGTTALPPPDQDPILQQIDKDLNLDIDFTVVTSEYETQLNARIAGGTPPDLFYVTQTQMYTLARQGYLLQWADEYLDKAPNLRAVYWDDLYNVGKVDGKMYALAKRPFPFQWQMYIRQDWLDALGLEMPKTINDLRAVSKAFYENDPDKNGKKDTYGLGGNGLLTFAPIFAAFGVGLPAMAEGQFSQADFIIKDNKLVYSAVDPATKDALAFIKDFIKDGSIDPEIMANKGEATNDKLYRGLVGISYCQYSRLLKSQYQKIINEVNPNAKWTIMDALEGPGGKYQGTKPAAEAVDMLAMPKSLEKTPEKIDAIMQYLNYITGDGKGQDLVCFGVEGVHYEKDSSGKITALPEMSKIDWSFIHQLTGRDQTRYYEVKYPNQLDAMAFCDKQPRILTYNSFIPLPEDIKINAADKETYQLEEITKFIYGKRPLDEFDDFVNTLNTKFELPKYMEVAEAAIKAIGYIK